MLKQCWKYRTVHSCIWWNQFRP